MRNVEEIHDGGGEGKIVGWSLLEKTVRDAITEFKKNTPAKQGFDGDDDVVVLSSRVTKKN